jgi:hypothetical protein
LSSDISPFSTAWKTTYNVIIFVREAGCKRLLAFSECKISPLRASITMAAYFWFAINTIGAVTQNKKESNIAPTRAGETCLRLN